MGDSGFQVSGVRCQERETQELKPEIWILTSNLRLAVSPRPRVILLCLVLTF